MKKYTMTAVALAAVTAVLLSSCATKPQMKTQKTGNTEVIEKVQDGKILYRLVYTYEGNLKVKGEYWEAVDPKKKDKKVSSNIFAGTSFAKKYESAAADSKAADTSGVQLNIQKDNLALKFVKIVRYNQKSQPVLIQTRGYTEYPVAGSFELKTDYNYTYDANGNVIKISEVNMNLDSFLLNMGVGNSTEIQRDNTSRPVKVKKMINSAPPTEEFTDYSYYGDTVNMQKTVYRKCSISLTSGTVTPSETITVTYNDGVPWSGSKKNDFAIGGKTVSGFTIYDETTKKTKLDASNFAKKSKMEQITLAKDFYTLYKNESKGPKWRMGELPDVPEPFAIVNDNGWWQ